MQKIVNLISLLINLQQCQQIIYIRLCLPPSSAKVRESKTHALNQTKLSYVNACTEQNVIIITLLSVKTIRHAAITRVPE